MDIVAKSLRRRSTPPPWLRRDAGRRVTRLAVCPLYTDNWATLAMAAAWLAKARDPTEVITCLFPAPEPAQRTRTEQVMCPDTAPPARARAGRTASCARHCTLWPLPLPHTGEDVHASDRPHTPRHRVRTLPLEPLVSFPTQPASAASLLGKLEPCSRTLCPFAAVGAQRLAILP